MMALVKRRLWITDCGLRTGGKMQAEGKMESAVCILPSVCILTPGLQSASYTDPLKDGCVKESKGGSGVVGERRGCGTVCKIYRVGIELNITSAFSSFSAKKFSDIFEVWSDRCHMPNIHLIELIATCICYYFCQPKH